MSEFRFDCAFCDGVLETTAVDVAKRDAKTHLADRHRSELEAVFAVAFGGKKCRNDCGYVFPDDIDEVAGFECPTCGHDNFPSFVKQYVFWRIEKP